MTKMDGRTPVIGSPSASAAQGRRPAAIGCARLLPRIPTRNLARTALRASLRLLGAVTALLALVPGTAGAEIKEFTIETPKSGPDQIAVGPDGNLWFTESGVNKIGRITPKGVITEFGPTSGTPRGITAGPNGERALWFAEGTGETSKIGRITTKGVITNEFPVPIPPTYGHGTDYPTAITAGPEGALWFTGVQLLNASLANYSIARITTSGGFTGFVAPSHYMRPRYAITTGPDGNLWATAEGTNLNEVVRMTPGGTYTEYLVAEAKARAEIIGITVGPDGALWFTEQFAGKIGRITTAGVKTNEFPLLPEGSRPSYITKGSDGALWFTDDLEKIGRITTAGEFIECGLPSAGRNDPSGITQGPDGAFWFTESVGNRIGRITDCSPSITKLKPKKGPVSGGTNIVITGKSLSTTTSVKFGSKDASSFVVNSGTEVTAVSPGSLPGTVDVRVTAGGVTSHVASADHYKFTPTVTSVSPKEGPAAGGTNVTVTGTGFINGATTIKFGTATASSISCTSWDPAKPAVETKCTAVAPPHAAGRVDVRATVNKAISPKAAGDRFTYN